MTKIEKQAIADLQALAKRWPSSLVLVVTGCPVQLYVKRDESVHTDNVARWQTLAAVSIPSNSCA